MTSMVTSRDAFTSSTASLVLALLLATSTNIKVGVSVAHVNYLGGNYDWADLSRSVLPPSDAFSPSLPHLEEPPEEYEPRDAPPPPVQSSIRLVDAMGAVTTGLQGILQLSINEIPGISTWGAVCADSTYVLDYPEQYAVLAKLVCRQLGFPQRYASMVPASQLGIVPSMPSAAQISNRSAPCDRSTDALRVTDCEGVLLQYTPLDCSQLGLQGGAEAVAVICSGVAPPAMPPPAPWAQPLSLTTRLIDEVTSEATPGLTSGRLQVQMPFGGEWEDEVWGTVCGADLQLSQALAQYACLQAGHAGWERASYYYPSYRGPISPRVPVALITARDCTVLGANTSSPSLDCWILVGDRFNEQLMQHNGGLDRSTRLGLAKLASICAPTTNMHLTDIFVECASQPPQAPAPPDGPSTPSSPQQIYYHGVVVLGEEVLPSIYDLTFVVPHSNLLVAGTVCSRNDDTNGYFSFATTMTLCNNITNGERPYGFIAPAPLDVNFPFLDPPQVRQRRPVVLNWFECEDFQGDDASAPLPDLEYCQVKASEPLPRELYRKCWNSGWAASLLVCSDRNYVMEPKIVGLRLDGGPDAAFGRLEVLLRTDLRYGWGTVCDDGSFNQIHAQAVCRDLGLDWTGAEVDVASAVPNSRPPKPVLLTSIECDTVYGEDGGDSMSFVRDCYRDHSFVLGDCPADQYVVVHCKAGAHFGHFDPPASPMMPLYHVLAPAPAPPPSPQSPSHCHDGGYYGGYDGGYYGRDDGGYGGCHGGDGYYGGGSSGGGYYGGGGYGDYDIVGGNGAVGRYP